MLYKDIAPLVAIDAMGAPMPRIVGAVAQAANEFFRRTMAYKLSLPPVNITPGQSRVGLEIPATTSLVGILRVTYGGVPIGPATNLPGNWEELRGSPRAYLVSADGTMQDYVEPDYVDDDYVGSVGPIADTFDSVRLVPFLSEPEEHSAVTIAYAVAPVLSATSIPDPVGFRYQHAIVMGAKAFVLGDVGSAWSNPARASESRTAFETHIREAILDARLAAAPGQSVRVRMRR